MNVSVPVEYGRASLSKIKGIFDATMSRWTRQALMGRRLVRCLRPALIFPRKYLRRSCDRKSQLQGAGAKPDSEGGSLILQRYDEHTKTDTRQSRLDPTPFD